MVDITVEVFILSAGQIEQYSFVLSLFIHVIRLDLSHASLAAPGQSYKNVRMFLSNSIQSVLITLRILHK